MGNLIYSIEFLSARRQTLTIEVDMSLCDIYTLAVVVSYNVLFIMSGFETTIPPNSLPWSSLLCGFWFCSPETGKALTSYKDMLINSPPCQLFQPPPHHSMHLPFPASLCFLLACLATLLTSAPRFLATSNPTLLSYFKIVSLVWTGFFFIFNNFLIILNLVFNLFSELFI